MNVYSDPLNIAIATPESWSYQELAKYYKAVVGNTSSIAVDGPDWIFLGSTSTKGRQRLTEADYQMNLVLKIIAVKGGTRYYPRSA